MTALVFYPCPWPGCVGLYAVGDDGYRCRCTKCGR